jgi:hypothetical protein
MAIEVLIRLYDGTGGRHAGDIVSVKEAPCKWGACEGLPDYGIIVLDKPTRTEFAAYHVRHYQVEVAGVIRKARSKYRVDIAALPLASRTTLFTTGKLAITRLNQITPYLTRNTLAATNG